MNHAPANANEVVNNLRELTKELRDSIKALRDAEQDAAVKRHHADMVESRAFLNADGAMEFRKHQARVAAEKEEGEALVAEAIVRVLRAEIRSIETRIDVGRTFGATVRAELKTLGMDGAA
jgi:hypothetical protein